MISNIQFLSTSSFQTIKCLLIVPNPESALNEEAGKLLLEQYEDYSLRAKMMTDIHAKSLKKQSESKGPECNTDIGDGLCGKKRVLDKTLDKKKKDKKRALKRL